MTADRARINRLAALTALAVLVYATGCDSGGGDSADPVLPDTTPPTFTSILVSPNPATSGSTVTITFSASEALEANPTVTVGGLNAGFVNADGDDYMYRYVVAGSEAEGTIPVLVAGADSIGNSGTGSATVLLDFTAPTITLFSLMEAATNQPIAHIFQASATDGAGSGIDRFLIRTTAGTPTTADMQVVGGTSNPTSVDLPPIQGPHTVYFWVMDRAGLLSSPGTASVIFDSAPPVVTGFSVVPDATSSTTVALAGLSADGTGSAVMRWLVTTSGATPTAGEMGAGGTSAPLTASIPAIETTTVLYCWVMDAAGNISAAASDTVRYDITPPSVTATTPADAAPSVSVSTIIDITFDGPMDIGTLTTATITVTNTTAASNVPGTVYYAASSNRAAFIPDVDLAASSDFLVDVSSAVSDEAGTAMGGAGYQFTFTTDATSDTTAPTVTAFSVIEADTNGPVTVSISDDDVGGSGVIRWLILDNDASIPGTAEMLVAEATRPTSFTVSGTNGVHILYCWVMDGAGNVSDAAVTDTVNLDGTAPTISGLSITPDPAKQGSTLTITFTVSEALGAQPTVLVGGNAAVYSSLAALTYTYTYTVTVSDTEGANAVAVDVSDAFANASHAESSVWFDFTAPVITSFEIDEDATAGHVTIAITENDGTGTGVVRWLVVDGSPAQPSAASMLAGYTSRPSSYTVTGLLGTHTLYCWVMDAAGNINATAPTDSVVLDTNAPSFTSVSISPDPAVAGATLQISFTASETLQSVPTVTVGGNIASFSSQTALDFLYTYDVTGAEAEGPVTVLISGTDMTGVAGSSTGTVVFDFTAPSVTVDALTTGDTTPQLTGSVDDASAAIEITVGVSTASATNNGNGSWTLAEGLIAALAEGTYDVEAVATDPAGNVGSDATTDELVITAGGSPGVAVSDDSLYFSMIESASNPAAQTVTVSNSGVGTLAWTATEASAWLSLSPASGGDGAAITVSVNGTGLSSNTYSTTITVTDAAADPSVATIDVVLVVGPVAVTPSILSISPFGTDQVWQWQDMEIVFSTTIERASGEAAVSLSPLPTHGLLFLWTTTTVPDDTLIVIPDSAMPIGADNNDRLLSDTDYVLSIGGTYTNLAGTTGSAGSQSFRTWPDIMWPAVVSTTPSLEALLTPARYLAGGTILFTFDHVMDPSVATVDIRGPRGYDLHADLGNFEFDGCSAQWLDDAQLMITFTRDLMAGSTYSLVLTECTSVGDITLPMLPSEFILVTQGNASDTTPPSVLTYGPSNGLTGVNPADMIMVMFTEPIDPATIGGITIGGANKADFDITFWPFEGTYIVMAPLVPMPALTTVTVGVPTSIRDTAGNNLASAVNFSFTTRAHPTDAIQFGYTLPRAGSTVDGLGGNDGPGTMGFNVVDAAGLPTPLDLSTLGTGTVLCTETSTGRIVRGLGGIIPASEHHARVLGRNTFIMYLAPWVFRGSTQYDIAYSGIRDIYGRSPTSLSYTFTTPSMVASENAFIYGAGCVPTRVADGTTYVDAWAVARGATTVTVQDDMGQFSATLTVESGGGEDMYQWLGGFWRYHTDAADEPDIDYTGWHTFTFTANDGSTTMTFDVRAHIPGPTELPVAVSPVDDVMVDTTPTFQWTPPAASVASWFSISYGMNHEEGSGPGLTVGSLDTSLTIPDELALPGGSGSWAPTSVVVSSAPLLSNLTRGIPAEVHGMGSGMTNTTTFTVPLNADAYEVDDAQVSAKAITPDGAPQDRTLHSSADVDYISFTVSNTSTKYNVSVDHDLGWDTTDLRVDVYFGATLVRSGGDGFRDATFGNIGTHYLVVYENGGIQGNYTISLYTTPAPPGDSYENDNLPGLATVMPLTSPSDLVYAEQVHSIHTVTDEDWIRFTVNSTAYMYNVEDWDSSMDMHFELYASDQTTLLASSDYGLQYNAFTSTGTYYIRITPRLAGNIGWYTLILFEGSADAYEVDDGYTQASMIAVVQYGDNMDDDQTRTLHSSSDQDWVTFNVTDASAPHAISSDRWNVHVELYDTDGTTLLATQAQSLVYTFSGTGLYYVRFYSPTGTAEIYWASVTAIGPDEREPDDTPAQAKTIIVNECNDGTLHTGTDVDWITFYISNTSSSVNVNHSGPSNVAVAIFDSGDFVTPLASGTNYASYTFASPGWYYARFTATGTPTTSHFHVDQ